MLTIGSLFSGIGGLELGLEWAGLGPVAWQCEIDPFCRRVLEKHWPGVERYEDVKKLNRPPAVDLLCGGPPCQPFSTASRGRKVAEDLFPEFLRVVDETTPRFVVAENVALDPIAHAASYLRSVGYKATAIEIPASVVGATHDRPRWFLVADSNRESKPRRAVHEEVASVSDLSRLAEWENEPGCLGVDDWATGRVDRVKAIGNAVVPQCAEVIGWVIRELAGLTETETIGLEG